MKLTLIKFLFIKELPAWIVKKELPICYLGIGLNSNNMRAYPMKNKFSLTHYLNIHRLNYKLNCILLHFRYFNFFHYKMILM